MVNEMTDNVVQGASKTTNFTIDENVNYFKKPLTAETGKRWNLQIGSKVIWSISILP